MQEWEKIIGRYRKWTEVNGYSDDGQQLVIARTRWIKREGAVVRNRKTNVIAPHRVRPDGGVT